jgi:hypothetical protein
MVVAPPTMLMMAGGSQPESNNRNESNQREQRNKTRRNAPIQRNVPFECVRYAPIAIESILNQIIPRKIQRMPSDLSAAP